MFYNFLNHVFILNFSPVANDTTCLQSRNPKAVWEFQVMVCLCFMQSGSLDLRAPVTRLPLWNGSIWLNKYWMNCQSNCIIRLLYRISYLELLILHIYIYIYHIEQQLYCCWGKRSSPLAIVTCIYLTGSSQRGEEWPWTRGLQSTPPTQSPRTVDSQGALSEHTLMRCLWNGIVSL